MASSPYPESKRAFLHTEAEGVSFNPRGAVQSQKGKLATPGDTWPVRFRHQLLF